MVKSYDPMSSVQPHNIKPDSDFNMRMLVLKQVDRINVMLSLNLANTRGRQSNFRALGFGVKSALFSLESMIYPSIKKESDYFEESKKLQIKLKYLEDNYNLTSYNFVYWRLLNIWFRNLSVELSKLGYFPSESYEYNEDEFD